MGLAGTRYPGFMAFPTAEEITQRVQHIVGPRGFDVEKVDIKKAGAKSAVIIRIDGDQRPDLDVIEELSDEISRNFDAAERDGELNFGAGYRLEVSTPGLDEPLVAARHFRRQRGHLATFVLNQADDARATANADNARFVARIGTLNADETKLAVVLPGKKEPSVEAYPLDQIREAKLEVEFSTPPEAEMNLVNTPFDQLG